MGVLSKFCDAYKCCVTRNSWHEIAQRFQSLPQPQRSHARTFSQWCPESGLSDSSAETHMAPVQQIQQEPSQDQVMHSHSRKASPSHVFLHTIAVAAARILNALWPGARAS